MIVMGWQEIVLSPESDQFYKQNMYANFGDLGVSIKQLVDEYQEKSQMNTSIQTIGTVPFLFLFIFLSLALSFNHSFFLSLFFNTKTRYR